MAFVISFDIDEVSMGDYIQFRKPQEISSYYVTTLKKLNKSCNRQFFSKYSVIMEIFRLNDPPKQLIRESKDISEVKSGRWKRLEVKVPNHIEREFRKRIEWSQNDKVDCSIWVFGINEDYLLFGKRSDKESSNFRDSLSNQIGHDLHVFLSARFE